MPLIGPGRRVARRRVVGAAVKAGEVHRHPQPQLVSQFQLLVRQELVDAALCDVTGDGEEPVRLEPDETEFPHIADDVFVATLRRHQAVHARLWIAPHLGDTPAVVRRHVDTG